MFSGFENNKQHAALAASQKKVWNLHKKAVIRSNSVTVPAAVACTLLEGKFSLYCICFLLFVIGMLFI